MFMCSNVLIQSMYPCTPPSICLAFDISADIKFKCPTMGLQFYKKANHPTEGIKNQWKFLIMGTKYSFQQIHGD